MATFTNQATLSYNGTVTTSNITTGELLEVLSATKTALNTTYAPGDTAVYVVNLQNTGAAPFTGLTLSDDLGQYDFGPTPGTPVVPQDYVAGSLRYFVNGVLQATPTVTVGPPMTITGLNIPADSNALLVYEVRLNQFADPATGGTLTNTATITGGGLTNPVLADATITAASEPNLTIGKSLSPQTVTENGQLTYTFTILNTGNTAATSTDNVSVSDTFAPILSDLTVTFNGTALTSPDDYTYDETTGQFVTVPGRIVVPAATYVQNDAGAYVVTPGTGILTVTGTV